MFHMKNLKIAGLHDANLTGFMLHEPSKTIYMNFTSDFKVISDIILHSSEQDKIYSGTIELNAKIKTRSHYTFEINVDDNGVEHLCIGQETIQCKCVADPEFTFDEVLQDALVKDPVVTAKLYSMELAKRRKQLVCKIAKRAIPKLFDAHRQDLNPFAARRQSCSVMG